MSDELSRCWRPRDYESKHLQGFVCAKKKFIDLQLAELMRGPARCSVDGV